MAKFAIVKTGGKQYLVKENTEIMVDRLSADKNIELETLALFEDDSKKIEVGTPHLKTKVKAQVIENLKGDKIRVARFKSKVRYRKVRGFRAHLSRIKILSI